MAHRKTDMSSRKEMKLNWEFQEYQQHIFLVIQKTIDSSSISLTLIQHNEKTK
jgi:hypothetical protein